MNKITIELTSEELFEARFCVKRYSQLYPNMPNEYMERIRQSIIKKMTDAIVKWQDSVPEDYIPETYPKYDPCRKFRKGDKVCVTKHRHRLPCNYVTHSEFEPDETLYTVEYEEAPDGTVSIFSQDECDAFEVHFSHLELVTPVEELEPYSVETFQYGYTVNKGDTLLATYNDETHPHAHEAAEAECARLNAEYRKGMEK